jgi:hypothetical protein
MLRARRRRPSILWRKTLTPVAERPRRDGGARAEKGRVARSSDSEARFRCGSQAFFEFGEVSAPTLWQISIAQSNPPTTSKVEKLACKSQREKSACPQGSFVVLDTIGTLGARGIEIATLFPSLLSRDTA